MDKLGTLEIGHVVCPCQPEHWRDQKHRQKHRIGPGWVTQPPRHPVCEQIGEDRCSEPNERCGCQVAPEACDGCHVAQRSVTCRTPMNVPTAASMESTVERVRITSSAIPSCDKNSKLPITPTPAGTNRKDRFAKMVVVVGLRRSASAGIA